MSFELYTPSSKQNRKSKRANCVGFSPKLKKLSFYRPILEKHLKGTEFVHLYYDKDEKLIGIKPADQEDPSTLKLTGNKTKVLMIGRFLKQFEIEINENKQFPIEERDGMLVLKIF